MEESVPERRATYECTVDGWRWRYELCPEKMIATGTHGEQYQRFQMDLKHSDPVPDHGETFRLVLAYPRWLGRVDELSHFGA